MFPYSTLSLVRFWIHAHASSLRVIWYGPLYLAVACSTLFCARGVLFRRFSGRRLPDSPYSALLGLIVDTCIVSLLKLGFFMYFYVVLLGSEFANLMSLDRSNWPRCLLWHGWLPGLSCVGERGPWARSFGDLAC